VPGATAVSIGCLDRVADVAEDAADLAAQENEGDDSNDRDEREDQCVLGETLARLVRLGAASQVLDEVLHFRSLLLSSRQSAERCPRPF
jgi:hypothetical protein